MLGRFVFAHMLDNLHPLIDSPAVTTTNFGIPGLSQVSAHDSFRLLKTHMPEFVDRVGQVVANGRTCDVWIPQTWPSEEVPTDHNAPCKVTWVQEAGRMVVGEVTKLTKK